jgi:hypothetical protein
MAEPWIRVHANLHLKPVIGRAVEVLGVKRHEAIGLLVTFWGAVSQHVTDGLVGEQSDSQLETWADWRGKRGRFAAFIREQHLDADGRVNEWQDYQGPLDARRANDRERQRRHREQRVTSRAGHTGRHAPVTRDSNGGVTRDESRDVTVTSALTRANETKRDETTASSSSAGDWIESLSDAASANVRSITARSSNASACLIALGSMATGNDPATPQPTSTVLEQALNDYAANGDRWNAALFRAYVRRATAALAPADPIANGVNGHARASPDARRAAQGGARNDETIDAQLPYLEAKYGD